MDDQKKMNFGVPAAIVLAGLVVAGAIFFRGGTPLPAQPAMAGLALDKIMPLSQDDRIIGSPDAPVKIIEYSDLECPFCKAFHRAVVKTMEKYGPEGNLAWVYRHFPLDSIHPKARPEAVAAECAREQGGNEAFFAFIDAVFTITPSNNGLDLDVLPEIAEQLGLDRTAFETCQDNRELGEIVETHFQNAMAIGADGTPFVLIAEGDNLYPIFKTGFPEDASDLVKTITTDLGTFYQEEINNLRGGN